MEGRWRQLSTPRCGRFMFLFQAEDGIRDYKVTGVQTCALPISIILIDSDLPGFEIPYALIGGIAAASGAFLVFVVGMLLRARRRPVVSGREEMIEIGRASCRERV